ncbi:two-component sensor histidine kinase [Sphaerisporangium rufum]|uniref:histidine kinase n=1 Tax=Sphaerisporangium rufum TaxID=1381558 RepID=A0A919R4L2_9ACTN|nr:ATP-binding protein [Sphaerisporangium rufum]GII79584.1 two-component sensor histidine kinase [Sphaerisporangium rufum]
MTGPAPAAAPVPPAPAATAPRARTRPVLAALSARTPLRVKLIATMLALVAIALAVVGVGSVSLLRGYLMHRVDQQLDTFARDVARRLQRPWPGPAPLGGRIPPEGLLQVRGQDGRVLATVTGLAAEGRPGPVPPVAAAGPAGREPRTVRAESGGGTWRVLVAAVPEVGSLVLAIDLSSVDQIIGRLVLIEALGGAAVTLGLAGLGAVIVRRSLRPLAEMEHTAAAIAAGDLGRRVPDRDPRTEVGSLAGSLNGMLAQIEAAFQDREIAAAAARASEERMRRFVADASHELRTPLTTIRGFAEFYRQNPAGDPARLMLRVEEAAARMGVLVEDLLLLARLDGQRPPDRRPVDLLALAGDAVQDARILAADREITLEVAGDAAPIVAGDEVRLRQIIGNLVSNALAHTPPGTPITVRTGASGVEAFLEVADKGPGLAPEDAERIFERFYRADRSRARTRAAPEQDPGGSGLGLAIVAGLVAAHGGTVTVDTAPGAGATFRVLLPLTPEAHPPAD